MTKDAELQAYFTEAASWDRDRVAMERRSARMAWWVAGAGWVASLALVAVLVILMPLKKVEPFVIRVDNASGMVDVVPVYVGQTGMPETVSRYFLTHYVTVCERFNFPTAESDYQECGAFHTPQRNQIWYAAWAKTNPNSPLNLYRDGSTVEARVTSVSFFTRSDGVTDVAQVRYVKAKRQAGSSDEQKSYFIASIRYAFAAPPSEPEMRRWNPLGFKVIDFRSEPEALPPAQSVVAAEEKDWRWPMKERFLAFSVFAVALGINGQIHADAMPMRGPTDSRIRTALYSPDEVYRLYGFVGYALDLEFASDEVFVGLSAGDPEAVTYSAHENVLTLRPKAASSQMNLTVSTTKRRYYFEYNIAVRPTSRFADEAMYAVRFMYPANPAAQGSLTPEQRVARDLALAQKNRPRNVDYWFCGNSVVKPVSASDDGVHTRLTFAPKAELPAIFVSNDDGSESLLNFSMDAGDVVIHRVAARFIVRRGRLTGCIVNKGFAGSSERLESGTIAPEVTRERKEIAP